MSRNVDEIFLYLFDFWEKCLDACHSGIFLLSGRKYLLIFRDKCFTIYIKVGESGAKG